MEKAPVKSKCVYCGNNPIPHTVARINEYVNIVNKPLEGLGRTWIGGVVERLLDEIAIPLTRLGSITGLVKFNTDPAKAPNDRSRVIWEEAQRRGIPMRQLILFGKATDLYEALPYGKSVVFESLPVPGRLRTSALEWMDDKLELKRRLQAAGLPAARGGAFDRFGPMREMFNRIDKPVIVKPALGSRGRHTTTFIYTEEQLKQAFDIGKQISRRLVMEEHLFGSVYRGTIVDGKLLGVLRGDPPRITGDGVSTIEQLIEKKNKNRHHEVKEFKLTPLTLDFLARSGYTPHSVLEKNKTIDLTEKIGTSYGGYRAEEIHICHPKTKEILEAVGRVVNFPVMGFDFIIQDITKDPDTQKWGILECNSLPFIDLHHHPLEGPAINIAQHLWNWWE